MTEGIDSAPDLYVAEGGNGEPLLVLLHGLAANGAVWDTLLPFVEVRWTGRWLAPDLRGHGRTGHARHYGIGQHAADVAALIADGTPVTIVGHSMGGLVGLALASGWFGIQPRAVVTIGMKVTWTEQEFAGMRRFADSPVRRFDTREEAITRFLRVSGLEGLVSPDSAVADAGVVKDGDKWRLAADQRTVLVGCPPLAPMLAAAQCPVVLARGETDGLVTLDELRAYDPNAEDIPEAGHNAQISNPEGVWALVERTAGG